MPPEYINCLRLVLTEMVPKLVREGVMDESSHIILPNTKDIFENAAVIAAVDAGFQTPNGRHLYLLCEPIPCDEHPLYIATNDVDPMLLNALAVEKRWTSREINTQEVELGKYGTPESRFLRLEFTEKTDDPMRLFSTSKAKAKPAVLLAPFDTSSVAPEPASVHIADADRAAFSRRYSNLMPLGEHAAYGFSFIKSACPSVAEQLYAFYSDPKVVKTSECGFWIPIRGKVNQFDALEPSPPGLKPDLIARMKELNELADDYFREGLRCCGITTPLHCSAMKTLRVEEGQGLQPVHLDVKGKQESRHRVACIMYLVPTQSTAMPRLTLDEMEPALRSRRRAEHLCAPEHFQSFRVECGDMMIFNTRVLHFGVQNTSDEPRLVFYAMYSTTLTRTEDTVQFFPLTVESLPEHPC
jgi:hypothetical protein